MSNSIHYTRENQYLSVFELCGCMHVILLIVMTFVVVVNVKHWCLSQYSVQYCNLPIFQSNITRDAPIKKALAELADNPPIIGQLPISRKKLILLFYLSYLVTFVIRELLLT